MAKRVGQITVNLSAGTAQFVADMEKAKVKVREFGSHGVTSVQAASGAIRTLEGNFQNNVRAVERFMVTTLKLGPVLQAAFPIVGAIAFLGIIQKMGEELHGFVQSIQLAPEKIGGAFRELNAPLRATNDELRVANDRLENDIAKLEGRRQNTLKLALDEARLAADKLADSLDKDLANLNKLLKEEEVGFWRGLLGEAKSGDLRKQLGGETGFGGFRGQVAAANEKIIGAGDPASRAAARKELEGLYQRELSYLDDLIAKTDDLQKRRTAALSKNGGIVYGPGGARSLSPDAQIADQTALLEMARKARVQIAGEAEQTGLRFKNESLVERKGALVDSGARQALEETNRLIDERNAKYAETMTGLARIDQLEKNEIDHLLRQKELAGQKPELVGRDAQLVADKYEDERIAYVNKLLPKLQEMDQQIIEQANHFKRLTYEASAAYGRAFQKDVDEGIKKLEESGKAVAKVAQELNKIRSEQDSQALGHAVRMIGIEGRSEDPMAVLQRQQVLQRADIEQRYQNSREKALAITNDALRVEQLATIESQRKLELDQLDNQVIEQRAELQQKGVKDFFREMQHGAQTTGNILYNSMHSALDRVSGEFANLVTGQKANFGKVFQEVGHQALQQGIRSGLQQGLGALGGLFGIKAAPKADGSQQNPFWVRMAGFSPVPALPGGGSLNLGGLFGSGSKGGGIFSFLGSLFGGARADGGPVSPGSAYMVGERGPELFFADQSGYIASNSASQRVMGGGGSNHFYNIDARGTDPQLVEQRVYRAIKAAHDNGIRTSIVASVQRAQRVPPGR